MDEWKTRQVKKMMDWGNLKANAYYEANMPRGTFIPTEHDGAGEVERFLRDKYERKLWAQPCDPEDFLEDWDTDAEEEARNRIKGGKRSKKSKKSKKEKSSSSKKSKSSKKDKASKSTRREAPAPTPAPAPAPVAAPAPGRSKAQQEEADDVFGDFFAPQGGDSSSGGGGKVATAAAVAALSPPRGSGGGVGVSSSDLSRRRRADRAGAKSSSSRSGNKGASSSSSSKSKGKPKPAPVKAAEPESDDEDLFAMHMFEGTPSTPGGASSSTSGTSVGASAPHFSTPGESPNPARPTVDGTPAPGTGAGPASAEDVDPFADPSGGASSVTSAPKADPKAAIMSAYG